MINLDGSGFQLTASELRAIEDHKYFLSQQRGREVSIGDAIRDFLTHYAADWRREKLRRDNEAQCLEIVKHKYLRSQEEQRDIGSEAAAEEWCARYAPIWRRERESLEQQGFQTVAVVVRNAAGLHLRPVSAVTALVAQFDCDIYVHKDGMSYYNFLLDGRAYMNVKSILSFLSLGISQGTSLEFIATGAEAAEALVALAQFMAEDTS